MRGRASCGSHCCLDGLSGSVDADAPHACPAGRHCAKIDVTVKQPKGSDKSGDDEANGSKDTKKGSNDKLEGDTSKEAGGKKDKDVRLPERLCIDPQHLALFAPAAEGSEGGESEGERGLAIRYVQLTTEFLDAEAVRRRMEELRSKDDEADLHEEVRVCFWREHAH